MWSPDELMIGGALAGIMHGSFRRDGTSQYLSISMPNTFSMSPAYVANYIRENGLVKLDQDVFECLRDKLARVYLDSTVGFPGHAHHLDAASLLNNRNIKARKCRSYRDLTSLPPSRKLRHGKLDPALADGTRRSWAGVRRRPKNLNEALDHRHTYTSYKQFLCRMLQSARRVLKPHGVAVFVIGDVADPGKDPLPLAAKIWQDVGSETGLKLIDLMRITCPFRTRSVGSGGRPRDRPPPVTVPSCWHAMTA